MVAADQAGRRAVRSRQRANAAIGVDDLVALEGQAGEEGAVVSEFSSTSRDDLDVFTDRRIVRAPAVE